MPLAHHMAGVTQLLQVLWHQFEAEKRHGREIFEPRFFHVLGPTVRFCFLLSKIVLHMIDFHIYNTVHIFTVNKKKQCVVGLCAGSGSMDIIKMLVPDPDLASAQDFTNKSILFPHKNIIFRE